MNMLRDSQAINSPDPDMTKKETRTPLRKDELEKIARELKSKLQRASVTAKQLKLSQNLRNLPPDSPASLTALPKLSPLKNYYMWKRQIASGLLTLLPNLYSPGKLPTLTKPLIFLLSSPLKEHRDAESDGEPDSPIKRRRAESGAVREPQMVLQAIPSTPPKVLAVLHPLPVLTSNPARSDTTPTMAKAQLNLLKTPTQRRDGYNDDEGADLLMFLATSPSPAKPYGSTPRATLAPNGAAAQATSMAKPVSSGGFIAPAPPLTPKRPMLNMAKTPQNRITPSFHSLVVLGSALPSAGLALTPAGFNMSDYVNFFTPLPGAAATSAHGHARSFLKTPDFQNLVGKGDKMMNFDRFGPPESKD